MTPGEPRGIVEGLNLFVQSIPFVTSATSSQGEKCVTLELLVQVHQHKARCVLSAS